MVSVTENIMIDCPAKEVFILIGSYENDPKWRAGVLDMRHDSPGKVKLGTKTREVMRFVGKNTVNYAEVVEYEAGHKTVFKTTAGPISATGYRLVEANGEQTCFTYSAQSELSGLYRFLSPLIVWIFHRRVQSDLERLKQILETNE